MKHTPFQDISQRNIHAQVFPKSIEVMVPLLCCALVVPAWLHEEATHRVVSCQPAAPPSPH